MEVPVPVERVVEVPVERIIEEEIKVPIEKIIERQIEQIVERPVERIIEVPRYVDNIIEKEVPFQKVRNLSNFVLISWIKNSKIL